MKLLKICSIVLLLLVGCDRLKIGKKENTSDYDYFVETIFGETVFETNSELEAYKYALNLNLISKHFGSNYCYFVKERKK